jgi:hypothetical protein
MLYTEVIVVCPDIHTNTYISLLFGKNIEFSNVKFGDTYITHWSFRLKEAK